MDRRVGKRIETSVRRGATPGQAAPQKKCTFLKKEPKNFCACDPTTRRDPASPAAEPNRQKFFGSFFQKRTLPV
jgi:hypothetical protein